MRFVSLLLMLFIVIPAQAAGGRDTLYQVSTIDALLAGLYDGVADIAEVTPHGDFGLGTFDRLDGELILLDGEVYQAAFDGSVNLVPPGTRTPFVAVTQFEVDRTLEPPVNLGYSAFKAWLEERLPSRNVAYAVKVDGTFTSITFRSVPRQDEKPYPALADVSKRQALFQQQDIAGTLVGFWCPAFTKGLNVPGFHLHFLSADRQHAGHVLDFTLSDGTILLDLTNGWEVWLPMDQGFLDANLGEDRSAALHKVEQEISGKRSERAK